MKKKRKKKLFNPKRPRMKRKKPKTRIEDLEANPQRNLRIKEKIVAVEAEGIFE